MILYRYWYWYWYWYCYWCGASQISGPQKKDTHDTGRRSRVLLATAKNLATAQTIKKHSRRVLP